MKKFLLCLVFFAAFMPAIFADDFESDYNDSEKVFAVVPGLRLSILGLEPTIGINFHNLETELGVAISTGLTGNGFGIAPNLSVGYCTNPFDKGISATFGAEYFLLTSSYINLLNKISDDDDYDYEVPAIHAVSLYYKGVFNFNKTFGLLWRVRLPLVMAGGGHSFNITNTQGALVCGLIGFCTISVGVKFSI